MRNGIVGVALAAAAALAVGCGGASPATTPNQPATPTPAPTPTPTIIPTPTPTPFTYCPSPSPPPLYGLRVKVGNDQGYKKVLDARALVGKDAAYCAELGLPGDICVVRNENAPDAVTCNNLVMGIASQTGRHGPNWYWNGQRCRGMHEGGDQPGCRQHTGNQFFAFAFGPGTYKACGDNDRVCKALEIK